MRKIILIIFIVLFSCNNTNDSKIDKLYKQAIELRNYEENEKAIKLYERIISINKNESDAYRNLSDIYFTSGNFKKAYKINQKLIELNPQMYYYQIRNGLLLELLGKENEAQKYYENARTLFKEKEEYYWSKYDSISVALMIIEIDSIRGRSIIDSIIDKKINKTFPEKELRSIQKRTHGEMINQLKSIKTKKQTSKMKKIREKK